MRLAFLIRSLEYGGAERQLLELVKALDPQQFEISVVCFYGGGPLAEELLTHQVNLIDLGKRSRWDLFSFFWRLIWQFRQLQPQILHGYLGTANLLAVFLKPLLPKTKIVWGVRASDMDLDRYDWLSRLLFRWECHLARFADRIIVNSQAGLNYHVACGFPKAKMTVIPNGIDTERFRPDPEAGDCLRQEWGIPQDAIAIGLIARLDPIKDHPTFLKAAAELIPTHPSLWFLCIGGGPEDYATSLQQMARELGIRQQLLWLGSQADMPAAYNACTIATLTSISEGFSNAIGEAMACDIPCVVTDVGDSAWIVGETGKVVPPQAPTELAAGWVELLGEMQDSPNRQSPRQRIVDCFSVARLAERTAEVLNRG